MCLKIFPFLYQKIQFVTTNLQHITNIQHRNNQKQIILKKCQIYIYIRMHKVFLNMKQI